MSAAQELIIVPKETALTVFSADEGLEPFMAKIRAEIDAFVPDISTRKGRESVASMAHKVAKSKSYLDGVGKDLVAELKELPKKIDASRKQMRDTLDAWKDEVRKPLTEWERAEEARQEAHKLNIDGIKVLATETESLDSGILKRHIEFVERLTVDDSWEEFETEAARAKDATLTALRAGLEKREKYEAEQAELARLRAESEERDRKEREQRIATEAAARAKLEAEAEAARQAAAVEAKAKAEREAAERRELELRLAAEKAERGKLEAQERAARQVVEAEERTRREADEQRAREQAEAEKRESNKRHAAKINNEALAAFIAGGLTEECAKTAVTLIAKRAIPNVSIAY